jgi:ElaB/YqjD/DUF883 family membrane-anchored ribosome-binding protein
MMQDAKTMNATVQTGVEGLVAQLATLREEMAELSRSVASKAERRGRRMASDISDGMDEAVSYVERKGRRAEADFEQTVATHPLMAIGLAAAAGLVIGALARR